MKTQQKSTSGQQRNNLREKALAAERAATIDLAADDQLRLMEALLNPRAPNDMLLRAKRLHQETVEVR